MQQETNPSYMTPPNNCQLACYLPKISTPNCECLYPYTGTLVFRANSLSDLRNLTYYKILEMFLKSFFASEQLPVSSVSVSNPTRDSSDYLSFNLTMFPRGQDNFSITGISAIAFRFSNQIFILDVPPFGPYYFIGNIPGKQISPPLKLYIKRFPFFS